MRFTYNKAFVTAAVSVVGAVALAALALYPSATWLSLVVVAVTAVANVLGVALVPNTIKAVKNDPQSNAAPLEAVQATPVALSAPEPAESDSDGLDFKA